MIFERGHFSNSRVSDSLINESLRQIRNFSSINDLSSKPNVFISHKHDDLEDLKGIMGKIAELGGKSYIDSMDNKMPTQTNGETASRIKSVIKSCNKFILLATDKAIESYWCNWELGIGDTYKYIDHIAIVAIKEKGTYDFQYKGNEYLQIYPTIDYEDGKSYYNNGISIPEGYYVAKPRNKDGVRYITPLSTWLYER
jgi:hypothetical protein